jgi:hypothetical protein
MTRARGLPALRAATLASLLALILLAALGPPARAQSAAATTGSAALDAAAGTTRQVTASQPTLLVYSTVERLLSGDLLHTVSPTEVRADLARYPANWDVVGVGTTGWIGRNGELMPDGTTAAPRFWWADPDSPSQAMVVDVTAGGVAPPKASVGFPFIGLAAGDPATAITWTVDEGADVHRWLAERLGSAGIGLAGVQLRGEFGPVKTSVAYNIPLTGLDLSGGYVGDDYFRFGDYPPATWTMNGVYAADPALQPVVSTAGNPLHLHGYQPATMLGGHIGSATARRVTATIWPLAELVERPVHLLGPPLATYLLGQELFGGVLPRVRRPACGCPACAGAPPLAATASRGVL